MLRCVCAISSQKCSDKTPTLRLSSGWKFINLNKRDVFEIDDDWSEHIAYSTLNGLAIKLGKIDILIAKERRHPSERHKLGGFSINIHNLWQLSPLSSASRIITDTSRIIASPARTFPSIYTFDSFDILQTQVEKKDSPNVIIVKFSIIDFFFFSKEIARENEKVYVQWKHFPD